MLTNAKCCDAPTEGSVLERVRNFNSALDRLMRLYTSDFQSVEDFIKHVTAEASRQLNVSRVSIWSLSKDHMQIWCADLYEAERNLHTAGAELYARDFPAYFEAMISDRVVDAVDAAGDPRTSEFKESYLQPNRIVSMLDAQIRSAAGPRGVVCAESVDEQRDWTPDEIAFVVSIAELVGFAMDRRDREIVHATLEQTNTRLEKRNLELRLAKEKIEAVALQDALTGLPNRRHMEKVAQSLIDDAAQSGTRLALLHIDLDHFKEINDHLGHAAGDMVLKHLADSLKDLMGEEDFAARIGGDEFVALVHECDSASAWHKVVEEIFARLSHPLLIDKRECKVDVSIGVAVFDEELLSAPQMLGNADIALYRAKRTGRNRAELYCDQMRREGEAERQLHEEILTALECGQFVPFFQPQFDAKTLKLVGLEALARWQHPTRGLVPPSGFLAAAEEIGCIDQIDQQILEQSIEVIRDWESRGLVVPRLSVNVSGRRLSSPGLADSVKRIGNTQTTLSFELVETIFLDETSEHIRKNLRALRRAGVEIEIDDFGTGHTSIAGLINIRPKRLKIDRQLIGDVENNPVIAALTSAIVDIAQTLEVAVVAEGIETPGQIAKLSKMGCQELQGFGLGRPMAADAIFSRFSNSQTALIRHVA